MTELSWGVRAERPHDIAIMRSESMKEVQSSVGTPRRENPISKLVRAGSEPLHKTTLQILPPPESHPWDSFQYTGWFCREQKECSTSSRCSSKTQKWHRSRPIILPSQGSGGSLQGMLGCYFQPPLLVISQVREQLEEKSLTMVSPIRSK